MSIKGKLLYNLYFKPKGKIAKINKQGGLSNTLKISRSRNEMISASKLLQYECLNNSPLQVHFLTGIKYWYQTAFCAYSLGKQTEEGIQFVFHDDGTFNEKLIHQIKEQFPNSIIHSIEEINETLNEHLPKSKYPLLNEKRKTYPHIKKLTDVHCGSAGWKLMLDSDMLFFKYPNEVIKWLNNPQEPFFLVDTINSYHYSFRIMQELTKKTIFEKLNVGIIGLKSDEIDWEQLEYWIKVLEEKEGISYYLEQALSAMLVAGMQITIASENDYVVLPNKTEIFNPNATLHHYVAESKEWYFKEAWKKVIK